MAITKAHIVEEVQKAIGFLDESGFRYRRDNSRNHEVNP